MGRFLLLQVLKLGIKYRPNIFSKFFQTRSYCGYKVLFSKIIIVLENNKKPTQLGRFLFFGINRPYLGPYFHLLTKYIYFIIPIRFKFG